MQIHTLVSINVFSQSCFDFNRQQSLGLCPTGESTATKVDWDLNPGFQVASRLKMKKTTLTGKFLVNISFIPKMSPVQINTFVSLNVSLRQNFHQVYFDETKLKQN